VDWSHSRRSTYSQCLRRYYYTYFGSKKRKAITEGDKDLIRFLDDLPSRHLRAGDIMHKIIESYFRKSNLQSPWEPDRLTSWARKWLHKDQEYSRAYPNVRPPRNGEFQGTLLLEYSYQIEDVENLYAQTEERLVQSLYTFATSEKFREFRIQGCQPEALVETKFKKLHGFAFDVAGKIDLAYRSGDQIVIVDWKLGGDSDDGDESLQLAVYALWAADKFSCPAEAIQVYKAHLSTDKLTSFAVTENKLQRAKARIIQDAERMARLEFYGKEAMIERFTPCFQSSVCSLCPFQRLCYD
jgi:hypothetical protein